MTGLEIIKKLPNDIKGKIITEYGGIEEFYQMVFDLYVKEYRLFIGKPEGYREKLAEIETQINDIEDKLEELGLEDGRTITSNISSDNTEIIANKHVQKLDEYLKANGSDYVTMRAWMKKQYGI